MNRIEKKHFNVEIKDKIKRQEGNDEIWSVRFFGFSGLSPFIDNQDHFDITIS
jgi:hypothetical protein